MKDCKLLVITAILDNRKLCETGIFSWSSGIKSVLKLIDRNDIWNRPNTITPRMVNDNILCNLRLVYSNIWLNNNY